MKIIHLLRHAKSSWLKPKFDDIDRPLNARGRRSCIIMIEPLWNASCHFHNVYVSPAKRARSTANRLSKSLPDNTFDWQADPRLYTFDAEDLLAWLQDYDDNESEVMIIGHNPALTELANSLGDLAIDNLPTCGYVQLHADINSWQDLGDDCATTEEFLYPKKIVNSDDM